MHSHFYIIFRNEVSYWMYRYIFTSSLKTSKQKNEIVNFSKNCQDVVFRSVATFTFSLICPIKMSHFRHKKWIKALGKKQLQQQQLHSFVSFDGFWHAIKTNLLIITLFCKCRKYSNELQIVLLCSAHNIDNRNSVESLKLSCLACAIQI